MLPGFGTPDIAAVGAFFQRADNGVFTPAAANNQNFVSAMANSFVVINKKE